MPLGVRKLVDGGTELWTLSHSPIPQERPYQAVSRTLSFLQPTFIEHLLYAKCWVYSRESKQKKISAFMQFTNEEYKQEKLVKKFRMVENL